MKRTITIVTIFVLFAALGALTVAAQDDPCTAKKGFTDPSTNTCTIYQGVEINIAYPLELEQYPFIAGYVYSYLEEQRMLFLQSFLENSLPSFNAAPWSLNITYTLSSYDANVMNVAFSLYTYSGGAHPNQDIHTFTFDITANRILSLSDVFADEVNPWAAISPIVQQTLAAQLGDMTDTSWIETGTGTNPDNYKNWAAAPEGLTFYFPPYQVAAYVAGPQTVTIPWAQLAGMLKPPFGS